MSKAKGRRTVAKAKEYWESQGYIFDECELSGRFRKSKDLYSGLCTKCWKWNENCNHPDKYIFEGFDAIAMNGKRLLLLQIKTNSPATQLNYKRFAKKFGNRYIRVVVMTWYDRQNWRIQTYCKNGSIIEKDLR